jgi:hypothetical protein
MEMLFDAVYYFFVFINVFSIFDQEQLHRVLFYFLFYKATIALFSLVSSDVKRGLMI